MKFKTLLTYAPVADFTQPYPAIPYLSAFLKAKGENVIIKDLNIEAHEHILNKEYLQQCFLKLKKRFEILDKKNFLSLDEQNQYLLCLQSQGIDSYVISEISKIKQSLRDKEQFFDYKKYQENIEFIKQAMSIVSCAYFPTKIEPAEYSTPFFMSADEDIVEQTQKQNNPFIEFYEKQLIKYIEEEKPNLIGISVVYPSQILQMLAISHLIKNRFPKIHICTGGAFVCRMVLHMPKPKFKTIFKYVDSICLYEGETALYKLICHLKEGNKIQAINNLIYYDRENKQTIFPPDEVFKENLEEMQPPDYDGFPLDKYLSPEIVLPISPTRGCYWNKCSFCHYGATKKGTAKYCEQTASKIIDDMDFLAKKYKVHNFAFSVDVISPSLALAIASEITSRKLEYKWNTDLRFENIYNEENCEKLSKGGCRAVAIGLESGNSRILKLMNKGFEVETANQVVKNFSNSNIAVQVMSFLNFPTETGHEAMETIHFMSKNMDHISLFTMGDFELLFGSKIYENPEKFGIKPFTPKGDVYRNLCLYEELQKSKTEDEIMAVEYAYAKIAERFADQEFPFVGAVSTNHTLLYFEYFGKDSIKKISSQRLDDSDNIQQKSLKFDSKPEINSQKKIINARYSLLELNENIQRNTNYLNAKMEADKKIDRKHAKAFGKKNKVKPVKSLYIHHSGIQWAEFPESVMDILKLCNGKNKLYDIIKCKGSIHSQGVKGMLDNLYSMGILVS